MPLNNNTVSDIIDYFSKGFQRNNRFKVEINRNGPKTYWATSVQIPSQSIVYYPETFAPSGPTIYIPLKREFDERFLIDFIVESDWSVRTFFENWYNSMFSPGLITDPNRCKNIKTRENSGALSKIEISCLNENGEKNATFILHDAFPKLLLPSQFAQDAPNQYLTLTVDFNYRYYEYKPS